MRLEEELKNYLVCDLAAAKMERNLARLRAKRLTWAMLALAALSAASMGLLAWLILWLIQQPMPKPLLFV